MKKNLIILSGSPRGGEITWKSIKSNLIDPLNADLAVSYGDNYVLPDYLKSLIQYDWKFEEKENWRDYIEQFYSPKLGDFFVKGVEYGLAGIDGLKGSGAIVFSLIDIIYQYHLDIVLNYQNIIYTRFDQFQFMPLDHKLDENIYIPEGEDYFGINDRFIALPNKAVTEYFSICKYIETTYSLKDYEFLNTNCVYAEHIKFLENSFTVIRSRRTMATTATSKDQTRWRKAEFNFLMKNDLKLKYPDEFMKSIKFLLEKPRPLSIYIKNLISIIQYFIIKLKMILGNLKRKINKS